MVYSRKVDGKNYSFGVSGRLYKSNVLLYDHQTESLWSQLKDQAISGPMVKKNLVQLPSRRTTWKSWLKDHPNTQVLSTETGHSRDYSRDPYVGYYQAAGIMFPVGDVRKDLSPKEMVMGINIHGSAKAYPVSMLPIKKAVISDNIAGKIIRISVSEIGEVVTVRDQKGDEIPFIFSYWFAWQAFHPETAIYKSVTEK